MQLEDYVLEELIKETETRQVWKAHQASVKREVEVEIYFGGEEEAFLADVRVKAALGDGVLGLVFEVIPGEGAVGVAREALPTGSLADLVNTGKQLLPKEVTSIIRQISGALKVLDEREVAHEEFEAGDIRLDDRGVVRMRNVARAGELSDDSASRKNFTTALRAVLQPGHPGATRMSTLLQYIEGTPEQPPIPWSQAHELAMQVNEQLDVPTPAVLKALPVAEESPKKSNLALILLPVVALALVAAGVAYVVTKKQPDRKVESDLVSTVPAGRYPRPNGGLVELGSFRIDAHEVTIEEYADFLSAFLAMSEEEQEALKSEDWPEDKTNCRPDNWREVYSRAREKKPLNGRPMSLDCPVTGVDWWDANAFARWKEGQLPTTQQWWAAASFAGDTGESRDWGPVRGSGPGPHGLAGNVSEWIGVEMKNPAFPMNPKKPLACGASFKKPDQGALSRDWLENKGIQREDLGFRVAYPAR